MSSGRLRAGPIHQPPHPSNLESRPYRHLNHVITRCVSRKKLPNKDAISRDGVGSRYHTGRVLGGITARERPSCAPWSQRHMVIVPNYSFLSWASLFDKGEGLAGHATRYLL
ncbi:hypothetical protein V2G26_013286 [Clonostachys chloroleuca]